MKLKTIIIDDEPIALEKLRNYVEKVPFLELAGEFVSGIDAMNYLATGDADLLFTDINMPDINGLEFVKSLSSPPVVVFITAYDQYAVDSYRLSAADYILKPYTFADFQRAANKALEQYNLRNSALSARQSARESIFVKVDYRIVRVAQSDIRYVKGYGEYLQIFTTTQPTPLLTLSSFAAIKEKLSNQFVQVHRSYIVNMDHVNQLERSRILMDDSTQIPIGDSYKADLNRYLSKCLAGGSNKNILG